MSISDRNKENDGKPTDVDAFIPQDEADRRRWAADMADRSLRRDILLGQIARARSALYAAEKAGDVARVAELTQIIGALVAQRDALG